MTFTSQAAPKSWWTRELTDYTLSAVALWNLAMPDGWLRHGRDRCPTCRNLRQTMMGTWWFQVDACFVRLGAPMTHDLSLKACRVRLEKGTAVGYTHGAPAAPMNFAANARSGWGCAAHLGRS